MLTRKKLQRHLLIKMVFAETVRLFHIVHLIRQLAQTLEGLEGE
jgi:hypothetical protein